MKSSFALAIGTRPPLHIPSDYDYHATVVYPISGTPATGQGQCKGVGKGGIQRGTGTRLSSCNKPPHETPPPRFGRGAPARMSENILAGACLWRIDHDQDRGAPSGASSPPVWPPCRLERSLDDGLPVPPIRRTVLAAHARHRPRKTPRIRRTTPYGASAAPGPRQPREISCRNRHLGEANAALFFFLLLKL